MESEHFLRSDMTLTGNLMGTLPIMISSALLALKIADDKNLKHDLRFILQLDAVGFLEALGISHKSKCKS